MVSSEQDLTFNLQFRGQKQKVTLSFSATVGELQNEINKLTGVPPGGQKIVHYGKNLSNNDLETTLEQCHINQNDVLLLLGQVVQMDWSKQTSLLAELKSEIAVLKERFTELRANIDDSGTESQGDMNQIFSKGLVELNEAFMKLMEKLDSVQLEGGDEELKLLRKSLVNSVNSSLDQIERLQQSMSSS